jgi:hypothetical protein
VAGSVNGIHHFHPQGTADRQGMILSPVHKNDHLSHQSI